MADEKSLGADPALWIALAALAVSCFQAWSSRNQNKLADKRTKFIESIALEFAAIETSLDSLEQEIIRAKRNPDITSSDIAGLAIRAMRTTNRSLNKISGLSTVDENLFDFKRLDALDEVMNFANDGSFDGPVRVLHLETSHKTVVRVSTYCTELYRKCQSEHL